MISTINRENLLVAKGNYAVLATGTPIYQADGSISLMPGQLGIFDAKTHTSLNAGNVAAVKDIYIAIGIDTDGDGVSNEVRKVAGDLWNKNRMQNATAEPPRGACPEIWDYMFDCVDCGTDYGLKVQVDSTDLHTYTSPYQLFTYPVNVISEPCDTCGDNCDQADTNCNEIVCKMMDQINRTTVQADGTVKRNLITTEFPFDVERLYTYISTATIPCVDGNCGQELLAAVNSITINTGAVVLNLGTGTPADGTTHTYTVSPVLLSGAGATTMLVGQTKLLENQLNAYLVAQEIPGHFKVSKSCTDSCFTIQLNSCAVISNVNVGDDEDYDFDPSSAVSDPVVGLGGIVVTSPLTTTIPVGCSDCTDASFTTKTYTCGIRFTAKLDKRDCGCFPPLQYHASSWSKLNVFPTSGFKPGHWATNKVQGIKLAEGQGVDLRWREYKQQAGGMGRGYDMYNSTYGRWGAQGFRVQNSVTAECVPYCQYEFQHFNSTNSATIAAINTTWNAQFLSLVAIPQKDDTTKTSFEAVINPWLAVSNIGAYVTCGSNATPVDQDQLVTGESVHQ